MGFLKRITKHQRTRLSKEKHRNMVLLGFQLMENTSQHTTFVVINLLLLAEIASFVIYLYVDFAFIGDVDAHEPGLDNYPIPKDLFYVQSGLSFLFMGIWLLMMSTPERTITERALTMRTIVTLITTVPQLMLFFWSFADEGAIRGYVPSFMRIWWIHYYVLYCISMPHLPLSQLTRETIAVLSPLVTIMVTAAGAYAITVRFSHDENISIFDAFYYSFVTFGTIGFGDLSPSTEYGRALVICMILLAIYIFPKIFKALTDIISRRKHYTKVHARKGGRHVIIVGNFTLKDVKFILKEFYTEDRIFIRTRVVFLSKEVYAPEVYLYAHSPRFAGSVHLIIGNPQKPDDLDRCCAKQADAIFLMGSDGNFTQVDYDNVVTALTLNHYDAELPVHVVLKRATTRQFVTKTSSVIMVGEIVKMNLMGLGAILPGALPFVVNLVRNYDNPNADDFLPELPHGKRGITHSHPDSRRCLADGYQSFTDHDDDDAHGIVTVRGDEEDEEEECIITQEQIVRAESPNDTYVADDTNSIGTGLGTRRRAGSTAVRRNVSALGRTWPARSGGADNAADAPTTMAHSHFLFHHPNKTPASPPAEEMTAIKDRIMEEANKVAGMRQRDGGETDGRAARWACRASLVPKAP